MYRYCGKDWSEDDVKRIGDLIAASPEALREHISRLVCAAFEWRRPNGEFKLMSCKVAMLRMHRDGLIKLPPPRNGMRPPRRTFVSPASDPEPEVEISINDIEITLEVCQGPGLRLWNEFIGRYHYLGYRIMPGAQIRYLIKAGERILGAMGFGGPAWKVAPRDNFIGWTAEEREHHLHLIVNQTRFLILPWIRCKNLATKSLAIVRSRIADDWEERYGYRPVLLETFVDTTRFRGTCYKAGNWIQVGLTQGRSRMDKAHKNDQPIKSIWCLPLVPDFRKHLLGGRVE